jgi:hypothetical protein
MFTAAIASLFSSGSLLAQSMDSQDIAVHTTGNPIVGAIGGLVGLAVGILIIAGLWKIFTKAGKPGWAAIIPIYNTYIICKIAGKPGWWVLLLMIPFVNIIFAILLMVELARSFGKGIGYAVGLILLNVIFIPMLGFGDAAYQGAPAAA